MGVLKRKGVKSIIKDEWIIMDASDREIGVIQEDSMALALVRRFLTNLIPQKYHGVVNGKQVCFFGSSWIVVENGVATPAWRDSRSSVYELDFAELLPMLWRDWHIPSASRSHLVAEALLASQLLGFHDILRRTAFFNKTSIRSLSKLTSIFRWIQRVG